MTKREVEVPRFTEELSYSLLFARVTQTHKTTKLPSLLEQITLHTYTVGSGPPQESWLAEQSPS